MKDNKVDIYTNAKRAFAYLRSINFTPELYREEYEKENSMQLTLEEMNIMHHGDYVTRFEFNEIKERLEIIERVLNTEKTLYENF